MKTYCKKVDVTNPKTIEGWVALCCYGKQRRSDFHDLLLEYGGVSGVAVEIADRIRRKKLSLKPIRYFFRFDDLSRKLRRLGMESALQQCMDYVAVGALMPLFDAKIGAYQCASIPGRGQVFGKEALEKWVKRDWHNTQYYIKADVYHCYESLSNDTAQKFLSRDIRKNKTLQWFVMELLNTFQYGFSIGSYLSQYLCNYILSYAYHFASERLYKERRGKRKRLCHHVLFYMDDIFLAGSDKRDLKMAIKRLDAYMKKELGLSLKPTYSVKSVSLEGIDMMGYVVHNGYTTIRARIFLRARRAFLRAWRKLESGWHLTLRAAQRIVSYAGYFKHTDSYKVKEKLHFYEIFRSAIQTVSYFAKKQITTCTKRRITLKLNEAGQLFFT